MSQTDKSWQLPKNARDWANPETIGSDLIREVGSLRKRVLNLEKQGKWQEAQLRLLIWISALLISVSTVTGLALFLRSIQLRG